MNRTHRIRWSECDPYGHMNHAAYLTLFEDLRVAHWAHLTGQPIAATRPGPVIAQLEIRYLRPVTFDDTVDLTCQVSSFRNTSYVQDYTLSKDGTPCCTARAICVVTRQDTGAKVPLTDAWRQALVAEGAVAG
ncbi:acyl-CoA thioesterase [Falsiroseomonas selenitidurans]|uniref:Acyl-CoA thioesterase n=1 Tax=Falsiroseomonas selenitidurans TaxID=2716335 RepID=A0ABX1E4G9_9PROT|nr:thioesterase family protein [Falsiroseomonas selenitidurans]NKC30657.1 acyl-CoA thioesterase [Falsiroseomonas selenitidurans]